MRMPQSRTPKVISIYRARLRLPSAASPRRVAPLSRIRSSRVNRSSLIFISLIRGAEEELEPADRDAVAVVEHLLRDPAPIHVGAVGALQVVQRVAAEPESDLGVLARHASVVEHDVVLRIAADEDRVGTEGDRRRVTLLEHRPWRARLLAQQCLAVEHHRVTGLDRAEALG